MGQWKKTECNFCAVSCGLEVEIEDNKIVNVRPDPDSPRSKGYCCRKGRTSKYFQDNGDRLDYPMKKVGDTFERISWEQAFQEIGDKARKILDDHGPRSLALIGGPGGAAQTELAFAKPFTYGAGSQYLYNPIGLEFMGNWWSHGKIFGDQMHFTEADDENCQILILWGSNSYVTHNFLNSREKIREASLDPDRMLITVDPRMSESARLSDMHVALRPGTDSLLLRSLIALILDRGWENRDYLIKHAADYTRAFDWFSGFDYRRGFEVCRVPFAQMEELAKLLTTRTWGVHQDLGLFCRRHNTTNSYLMLTLEVVCGMPFVPGGCIVNESLCKRGVNIDENDPKIWRTVVTNSFPVLGTYPECAVSQEILTDNPDRLRMVFCTNSNPARSYPDTKRMTQALKALELLVVVDVEMTETARLADYILPAKNGFEQYDFNTFQLNFPEIVGVLKHPVVEAAGERRETGDIWIPLMKAMGTLPQLPDWLYKAGEKAGRTGDRIPYFVKLLAYAMGHKDQMNILPAIVGETLGKPMGSPNRAVFWAAVMTSPLIGTGQVELADIPRLGIHPVLEKLPKFKDFCMMDAVFQLLDQRPEGAVVGITRQDTMLERHIRHEDHKIHLYCDEINDYMKYLTPEAETEALERDRKEFPLVASSGRHSDEGHNGYIRDPKTYRFRKPYAVAVNPADAARFGLEDGKEVRLVTRAGSIRVPVEISYQMCPGYCMVPHHFGFTFEGETVGRGVNEYTSYKDHDIITGNPTIRYVPCRLEPIGKEEKGDE